MSLKKKFKTSTEAANSGVWFPFPDAPNEDGTIPRFLMARKTSQNKAYSIAMRDALKEHGDADGNADFADLSEADAEALELDVFTSSLLLGWEHFQPEDDGVDLEYSRKAAKDIFGNSDWRDLYRDLAVKCGKASAFRGGQLKGEAKN